MMELGKALNWYQKKIGAYDKQLWEKSVEQRILRGVNAIPKKTAKIKADLIDVDLVRGSYFPKAKPQHSWLAATSSGILRLLLFPVFFRWWKLQTCPLVVTVLLVLYFLQIIAIILYTTGDKEFSEVPLSEVTTPVVMMLVLAVIHSHIVATLNNKSSHNKIPQAKSRKRLKRKSRLRSSADYESKSSPETASEDRADHSQNCQAFHSTHFESKEKPGYSNSKSVLTEKDNYKEGLDLNQKTKGCFLAAKIGNRNVLRVASSNRLKNSDEESGLDSIDLAESPVENEIFNFGQHLPQCSNLCCGGQSSGFIEVEQDDKKNSKTSKVVLASVFTDAQSLPTAPTEDVLKSLTERGDEDGTSEADQDVPQSLVQQDNITNLKEECFVKYHQTDKPSSRNVMLDLQDSKELMPDWAEQEFLNSINSNQTWEDDNDEKTLIWRRFSDTVENRRRTTLEAVSDNQLDKSCRRYSEDSKVTPRTRNKIGLSLDLNTTNRKSNIISSIQERRETSSLLHLSPHPITERGHYSSCESEVDTTCPNTPTKPQTSDLEWPIITNTDCNSYSSDSTSEASEGEEDEVGSCDDPFAWEFHEASPHPVTGNYTGCEKVSCTIWERNECKKVDLTVLDISSAIVRKVDFSTQSNEYLIIGLLFSILVSLLPVLFRLQNSVACDALQDVTSDVLELNMPSTDEVARVTEILQKVVLGSSWRMNLVVLIVAIERFTLSVFYFFLLSVAERTFKQRFLYAKHFCHITSARRARRSDLPHFRLNKVRNIKTWLSVRSYLKKHGPQRSVDVIVSTAFIIGICMVSFLCLQLLKESDQFGERLYCWEAFCWCLSIGIFLMRFMILGSKLNKKYRNFSVLITEQINLYLHMEQKPHKKEELMLANNVLKLASDLLKELESPFKISGLCANPYLYNITKVVILSAFSAVLTELLGFKLKLHKIKIK
ncbi:putative homeodomain transcription factor isoform X3 [Tachypleus tridentatus]|uniref:putative homeodomain transcription factor isoform X3 n=2 Tax=Tachypleus tridentatus TaxID=6853 RepID=UPI003FD1F672